MADIRIKDLATTATTTASDDFMAVDGAINGTRKLSAATPAFLTSVTTPTLTSPASTNLTLAGGTAGSDSVVVSNTLAASSAIIGAFKVGNGTAATNVAIGGGKVNIGDTTAGSAGAGALVVAGGISAGQSAQASWFGGNISVGGTSGAAFVGGFGQAHLVGTSGSLIVFERTNATARQWRMGVGILGGDEWSLRDLTSSVQALTIAGATGAATFSGAVTIGGTVIHTLSATPASAAATGTVGTMSWDASYIYICTAANTWKRVAIATW
jgi:hypothetical protein